ncbi:hypothetical protein CDAR_313391 [Caerostris darwini]|uniref:Uncharacterized protein n=1 Tax=Caerostris darwini TaxID=1538125 RepID=A0AAV4U9C7_9ARAC|nr:hypothetical protein CDAR_313391 [Caerostris darwini]
MEHVPPRSTSGTRVANINQRGCPRFAPKGGSRASLRSLRIVCLPVVGALGLFMARREFCGHNGSKAKSKMEMENENFNRGLCAAKRSVGDFIGIQLNSSCAFVIYFCLFLDFTVLTIFPFSFSLFWMPSPGAMAWKLRRCRKKNL